MFVQTKNILPHENYLLYSKAIIKDSINIVPLLRDPPPWPE